jgi:hypothetical protein
MSLFMAVGSPALITYSLTVTILNRIWVRRIFETLLEQLDGLTNLSRDLSQEIRERLRAAQYLLQECQQVPMRASQVDGWLSSLVHLDKNHAWWMRVKKDLRNSRRGYTFSLVAQIGMAFVAYTFTIATSLNTSTGTPEGSQVILTAGGGIWIWMIPVIWGWIMCGTQARARSITEAVNDKTHMASRIDETGKEKSEVQYGIRSHSGLIPRPRLLQMPPTLPSTSVTPSEPRSVVPETEITHASQFLQVSARGELSDENDIINKTTMNDTSGGGSTDDTKDMSHVTALDVQAPKPNGKNLGDFSPEEYKMMKLETWLGFSIDGDEAREGPIFNYARLFTFRQFSSTITEAFEANLSSLKSDNSQKKNIFEVAGSCRLDRVPLEAYTPWEKIDSIVWHHMLIAAGGAIFVQWGTACIKFLSFILY